MAKFVCTDDEVMVDKVIGEKKTVGERLPSYGRDLVPYFVPGAAKMDEGSINVNTDIDALRRAGGGVLAIPPPTVSEKKAKKAPRKRTGRSPLKQATQSAEKEGAQAPLRPAPPATAPSRMVLAEPWAGPAFVNSPPPSCLPVPGFLLAPSERRLSPSPVHAQSEPTSPLRTGRLFDESTAQRAPKEGHDRAAAEFSLKRILQVA